MLILVGPSASGKTSIGKILEDVYGIKKVVTYTTRDKRDGEVDGVDYHFLTKEDFLIKRNEHFFFETIEYNNNLYGTSIESINDNSYIILDPNGLKIYQNSQFKTISFFLDCSKELRLKRMSIRGDKKKEAKERVELDDKTFQISQVSSADYFVDVNKDSIPLIAKKIYLVYKDEIEGNHE